MKKIKYVILALFLSLQVCGICLGDDNIKDFNILSQMAGFLKEKAVINSDSVNKDLDYGAIKGMTYVLDRHTNFFTPEESKRFEEQMQGFYAGIGTTVQMRNDMLTIISPFKNGPAEKAGLKDDDRIIKINGESTKDMKLDDAVKRLRGKVGTTVAVTILREYPEEKTFEVSIERGQVEIDTVYTYVFDNIGYILLTQFSRDSGVELQRALSKLQKETIKGVILDLRNNPGGDLSTAVQVVSSFVQSGNIVVSTEGRNVLENQSYKSFTTPVTCNLPLVVLINGNSASASELASGAFQDYGRAVILGETSFGKASVQRVYPLNDGSAIKITGAHYFTPKHRLIHEIGIKPDIDEKKGPVFDRLINDLTFKECFLKYARAYIQKYPEIKENELKITDAIIGDFASFSTKNGVLVTESDIKQKKDMLSKYLKAEIARIAFGYDISKKVMTEADEEVKHAEELINAMEVIKSFTTAPVENIK